MNNDIMFEASKVMPYDEARAIMLKWLKRNGYDGLFRLTGYTDCQCSCRVSDGEFMRDSTGEPERHRPCSEYTQCTPGHLVIVDGCTVIRPMSAAVYAGGRRSVYEWLRRNGYDGLHTGSGLTDYGCQCWCDINNFDHCDVMMEMDNEGNDSPCQRFKSCNAGYGVKDNRPDAFETMIRPTKGFDANKIDGRYYDGLGCDPPHLTCRPSPPAPPEPSPIRRVCMADADRGRVLGLSVWWQVVVLLGVCALGLALWITCG